MSVTNQMIEGRCIIDLQDKEGCTTLHLVVFNGYVTVTTQILAVYCNVHLQDNDDATALQFVERQGHTGIDIMIRKKKHKGVTGGRRIL